MGQIKNIKLHIVTDIKVSDKKMSSTRGMHSSNRLNRKARRDNSPPRREKPNDIRRNVRPDHEKSRNTDHDMDDDKERDKDRKRKEIPSLKNGKQIRSPRK